MPPQDFDPDEYTTPDFDPSEFSEPEPTSRVSPGFVESVSGYIPRPVKSAWEMATAPLVDVSPYTKSFAEQVTAPTLEDSESYWWPRIKGFIGGAAEGAADVVSGLSSPLNLATMGAGYGAAKAGAKGLIRTGRALAGTEAALSAPVIAHGAATAIDPTLSPSERAFGIAEMAGGAAGVKSGTSRAIRPKPSKNVPVPKIEATPTSFADEVLGGTEVVAPEPRPPSAEAQAAALPATTGDPEIDAILRKFGVADKPVEIVGEPTPQINWQERVSAGDKIPDFTQIADNGSVWVDNLYGKGMGGTARPEDLNFIYDTARMRGKPLPEPPPEIKAVMSPDVFGETVKDVTPTTINASAESAASAEALSRQAGMKGRGEQYVVFDQAGNKRPLIGPEAVDYTPSRGETYGIEKSDGTFIKLEDRGGKVTATRQVAPRKGKEYPGFKGQATEATPEITPAEASDLRARLDRATKDPTNAAPEEVSNIAKEVEASKNPPPPDDPRPPDVIEEERRGIARRALDFNKALLTSWDLSAPGRQGKAFILNKAWWTSLDDMVRAWGSPKAADLIHQSIIDHPSGYFKSRIDASGKRVPSLAERVKLDLADAEEVFKSSAVGQRVRKYIGITKSSRAHTAFLNKLRSDQFVSMMDNAKKAGLDPENNMVLAKAYADFINSATGRGSLNVGNWKLGRVTNVLNDVFFAPKNLSGQIRTWNNVLNPMRYAQYDPVMRKQALKSLFAVAGTGIGVTSLASMGGARTSTDPTNTDFMKIVVGDTRIDPFGGYQQFPVAAARLLLGQTVNPVTGKATDLTAGRFGQSTRRSIAERFFVNRLAPLPSFVWAWMDNRDFDGKPFEWKKAAFDRVFPIAMQDVIELAQEEPELAAVLAAPTALGLTGTQTYTRE